VKRENLTEGIPRSKGRRRTMEPNEGTMHKTQSLNDISTKLIRIAKQTRENLEPLTTLAHHVDMAWMREASLRTRKDGALGIDGQSAAAYAQDLEKNLQALLGRAKSGTYRRRKTASSEG
jgi:RNA-directed DNA polymerase